MSLQFNAAAPLFSLLQADGSRFELAQALGRERILIAFGPSLGWLQNVARRDEELADYQLQVLAVAPQLLALAPPSSDWLHIGTSEAPLAQVLEAYGVREGEEVAFLIGKDRGVKRIYAGGFSLDEVLALIDTMPMRRQEVQARE